MKKNSKCFLILLLSNLFFACSDEKSDYLEIDRNYIKFSHTSQEVPFEPKDMINIEGSAKVLLLFDQDLYIQNISLVTTFEVLTNEPVILSTGKTLGYIKIQDNILEIYKSSSNYKYVELNEQFDLSLHKGGIYDIGFHKSNEGITFFLKGGDIVFEIFYDINNDFLQNLMRGKPFFEVESGSVRVLKSVLNADYDSTPRISVYGDSFVEGIALHQYGLSLHERWCIKLANEIGAKYCFLDGKGGEQVSEGWLNRLKLENSWFKSQYVILSMGTNNYSNINDYKKYMKQTIDYIKSNGQTPILVTVTPRSTFNYHSTTRKINDWVFASGEKYIDIHKAVTKEGDASQWKDGYVLSDGVHPTIAGYDAMYKQVKKDCPFMFIK